MNTILKNHEGSTLLDLIKKACHPPATAPTPTARTDRANDFKFLLDVHLNIIYFPPPVRFVNFFPNFIQFLNMLMQSFIHSD